MLYSNNQLIMYIHPHTHKSVLHAAMSIGVWQALKGSCRECKLPYGWLGPLFISSTDLVSALPQSPPFRPRMMDLRRPAATSIERDTSGGRPCHHRIVRRPLPDVAIVRRARPTCAIVRQVGFRRSWRVADCLLVCGCFTS